jgi:hypothetical protein
MFLPNICCKITIQKIHIMKKFLSLVIAGVAFMSMHANAQSEDKSKRPSPPATATATTSNGVVITIDYSQPSVKGREIGKDLEPMKGKVWRTGANEATVFEVNKDVTINGKSLPAGKYGLFSIWNGDTWTIIFNKTWKQWGAFSYKDADDVLRVTVPNVKPATANEKMTINVDKDGKVSLAWGNVGFNFMVK